MNAKISFIKLVRLWGVIFLTAAGTCIIALNIFTSYQNFHILTDQIRSDYIAQQKEMIRQEVCRVIDIIKHEKEYRDSMTREKIKSRVYEAFAVAHNIYENNKAFADKTQIQAMILDALRPVRFEQGNGYYFAFRPDGMVILNAEKPELEGKNLLALQDTRGNSFIKEMIKIVKKSNEGFYEYYWKRPNSQGNDFKKISFVKQFKSIDWIIGTGLYVVDVENKFQQAIGEYVTKHRFGRNRQGYVFILDLLDIRGGKNFAIMYANANRPDLVGRYISDDFKDAKGKEFRKEFLQGLRQHGECYVDYWYKKFDNPDPSPKTSYFKLTPDHEFIVAAGVYLDDVEEKIAFMQHQLNYQTRIKIIYSVLIITGIIVLLLFLFKRLNRWLENDFNLFLSFFSKTAYSEKPINRNAVKFIEFDRMTKNANRMLEDKIHARQDLIDEREKLFVTIRSIGDGVIATDTSGRVVLMNKVAEKLTGWKLTMAKGKPLARVFKIVHAQTGKKVGNPVERVLKTGYVVGLANHTRLISQDNSEYLIADSAAPIKDSDGKVSGVVLVFRDVSKEYLLGKKLRQNEQFLNSIFDSIQGGITILNPDLTIRHMNRVMTEWFPENLPFEGKNCFKYYHNIDQPCSSCPTLRCLETGQPEMAVLPGLPGTGIKWIQYYSYPLKDAENDEITGVVVLMIDISERKIAEEEIQQMKKLKSISMLASGIAHDFNNILMGLFGNLSIAREGLSRNHPSRKAIEKAEGSMNRAICLTQQLLTFAKDGELAREDTSLGTLVEEIIRFDLSGSNVKPVVEQASGLWMAEVDKGQIQQVFSNLTINADQAMPEGGHLYITLENEILSEKALPGLKPGKYIKITVRDDGEGIHPKQLERIFEPYFTTKKTGNGLGLASAYSIIARHHGHISVESVVGKGTVFTLYLPASGAHHPPKPGEEPQTRTVLPVGKARILVMDDDEMIRDIIAQILGGKGYEVETAEDGSQTIDMYSRALNSGRPFDVVIMDLTIPGGMGGKEVMKKITALDPGARGIVSSGYADDRVMANHKDYGFIDVVTKPYTMDELQEVLNRVLEKQ